MAVLPMKRSRFIFPGSTIGRVFRTCSSTLTVHEQRLRLTTSHKSVGKQSSHGIGIGLVRVAELKDIVIVRIRCRVAVLHDQRAAGEDIGSRHESGRRMSLRRRAWGALRNQDGLLTGYKSVTFACSFVARVGAGNRGPLWPSAPQRY